MFVCLCVCVGLFTVPMEFGGPRLNVISYHPALEWPIQRARGRETLAPPRRCRGSLLLTPATVNPLLLYTTSPGSGHQFKNNLELNTQYISRYTER